MEAEVVGGGVDAPVDAPEASPPVPAAGAEDSGGALRSSAEGGEESADTEAAAGPGALEGGYDAALLAATAPPPGVKLPKNLPKSKDPRHLLSTLRREVFKLGGPDVVAQGWTCQVIPRRGGFNKGCDPFYFDVAGNRYRSRVEVIRALGISRLKREEALDRARMDAHGMQPCPFQLEHGALNVVSLGELPADPAYHDEVNLWPLGYKAEWKDPHTALVWTCEILQGPTFRVSINCDPPACGESRESSDDAWERAFNEHERTLHTKGAAPPVAAEANGTAATTPEAADAGAPPAPAMPAIEVQVTDTMESDAPTKVEPAPEEGAPAPMDVDAADAAAGVEHGDAMPTISPPDALEPKILSMPDEHFGLNEREVTVRLEGLPSAASCSNYKFVQQRGTWNDEERRRQRLADARRRKWDLPPVNHGGMEPTRLRSRAYVPVSLSMAERRAVVEEEKRQRKERKEREKLARAAERERRKLDEAMSKEERAKAREEQRARQKEAKEGLKRKRQVDDAFRARYPIDDDAVAVEEAAMREATASGACEMGVMIAGVAAAAAVCHGTTAAAAMGLARQHASLVTDETDYEQAAAAAYEAGRQAGIESHDSAEARAERSPDGPSPISLPGGPTPVPAMERAPEVLAICTFLKQFRKELELPRIKAMELMKTYDFPTDKSGTRNKMFGRLYCGMLSKLYVAEDGVAINWHTEWKKTLQEHVARSVFAPVYSDLVPEAASVLANGKDPGTIPGAVHLQMLQLLMDDICEIPRFREVLDKREAAAAEAAKLHKEQEKELTGNRAEIERSRKAYLRKLGKLAVRGGPLGQDRYRNWYYWSPSDKGGVYMQLAHEATLRGEKHASWYVFSGKDEVEKLAGALNSKGSRENVLFHALSELLEAGRVGTHARLVPDAEPCDDDSDDD